MNDHLHTYYLEIRYVRGEFVAVLHEADTRRELWHSNGCSSPIHATEDGMAEWRERAESDRQEADRAERRYLPG